MLSEKLGSIENYNNKKIAFNKSNDLTVVEISGCLFFSRTEVKSAIRDRSSSNYENYISEKFIFNETGRNVFIDEDSVKRIVSKKATISSRAFIEWIDTVLKPNWKYTTTIENNKNSSSTMTTNEEVEETKSSSSINNNNNEKESTSTSEETFHFNSTDVTIDSNDCIWVSRNALAWNLKGTNSMYHWTNNLPEEYKNTSNCHNVLFSEKGVHVVVGMTRKKNLGQQFIKWFDEEFIPSVKKSHHHNIVIETKNLDSSLDRNENLQSTVENESKNLDSVADCNENLQTIEKFLEPEILSSSPSDTKECNENLQSTVILETKNSDTMNNDEEEINVDNKNLPHVLQSPQNMFKFGIYDVLAFELNGLIWIRRSDVGKCLDCSNSYYWNKWVKDNERMYCHIDNKSNSHYPSCFISEHGLYRIMLKSNLKKAIPFQDWVIESLLPSVRKMGVDNNSFLTPNSLLGKIDSKIKDIIVSNNLPDFTNPIKCYETIINLLKAKNELEEKYNSLSQENEKNKSIINNILSYTKGLE